VCLSMDDLRLVHMRLRSGLAWLISSMLQPLHRWYVFSRSLSCNLACETVLVGATCARCLTWVCAL
jgi:hypothetical protein